MRDWVCPVKPHPPSWNVRVWLFTAIANGGKQQQCMNRQGTTIGRARIQGTYYEKSDEYHEHGSGRFEKKQLPRSRTHVVGISKQRKSLGRLSWCSHWCSTYTVRPPMRPAKMTFGATATIRCPNAFMATDRPPMVSMNRKNRSVWCSKPTMKYTMHVNGSADAKEYTSSTRPSVGHARIGIQSECKTGATCVA